MSEPTDLTWAIVKPFHDATFGRTEMAITKLDLCEACLLLGKKVKWWSVLIVGNRTLHLCKDCRKLYRED